MFFVCVNYVVFVVRRKEGCKVGWRIGDPYTDVERRQSG